jgi:uncharacterized integral membrane protein (TIGR00697 family)
MEDMKMKNEILWFILLIVNFSFIIFSYKKFGKVGLFAWIPLSTVLANIQVMITLQLFGFTSTLGNIIYASAFLVTDILSENYGRKEADKAVWIGFFSLIATTTIMNLCLLFLPDNSESSIFLYNSIKSIFSIMPRIAIASLIAYIVSQKHDVWAYHFWKKRFSESNQIWIRNNLSTMVSQLIDSLIFVVIAFIGTMPFNIVIEIFWTTYLLKWLVAALDTPFIYIATYLKNTNKINEI